MSVTRYLYYSLFFVFIAQYGFQGVERAPIASAYFGGFRSLIGLNRWAILVP